ncbi:hypothetical protein M8J75_003243 [Diaphorina citri]|nr:hypothetical protein M8J75_003243 [Diaphorina citri]
MISSVPIHHNSFTNELMWRTHFPVKQESLDDSASNVSPEIYADTEPDNDLERVRSDHRSDHLARFVPPTISTSPTIPSHQGLYLSPPYQQRDLSAHFKPSPNRISPYPMKSSPTVTHHKTSPTFHSPNSILSSPSPSGFYHQKISPSSDPYRASTPDKYRASPGRHSDLYRTSPNISADFHRLSPSSHLSGGSSYGEQFQSPHSYLPPSGGSIPHDVYRSLNFNLPKTHSDSQRVSPRTLTNSDEPLNMNTKQMDLSASSQGNQRLSPYSTLNGQRSPNYAGNRASPNANEHRVSLNSVSSENNPCSPPSISNQESHDSIDDSRSPSPVQNLKTVLKKGSADTLWNATAAEGPVAGMECINDIPSLKCYFCSYNTKSRIQLNKHMRDAHTESKIMPYQQTKDTNDESDEDNENETHSNLSEDFMMDEYDDDEDEGEDFAVNVNKVSQNANSNKRTSYKCKKCSVTFKNKDEYYVHQREKHIKREKLLECKLCPFVTEYKHHHEYHIKNHFKMKPFKCSYSNCKYSCNNQSMLNSHVKSHKSFYQFHCKNCNYATKYMHSFKLHLRKNNHEKGITLNEDGSVNNDIIIDIHGTRRGPKRKSRKLDENALQNINNNNCITETIKKTIHHESETEFNNNVTMSSNNGSSRSNSPISSVNYNNNNNNDSYYLNTKLFVYSHMAMMNEKTPEIWAKDTNTLVDNFKHFGKASIPEVVDLSESVDEPKDMQVDVEAPLDLSKSVETKPQHIIQPINIPTNDTGSNQMPAPSNENQNQTDPNPALIKIENRAKSSADMIRIVGKNNFNISNGNMFKNKNKIKLCKNTEKSLKNALQKGVKIENDQPNVNSNDDIKTTDSVNTHVNTINLNNKVEETKIEVNEHCDKTEKNNNEGDVETISSENCTNEVLSQDENKSNEKITALSEASKQAISTNKKRRRKGKAYKLQINNVDDLADTNTDEEVKEEEVPCRNSSPKVDKITPTMPEEVAHKEPTLPSTYEVMQMDYLKQIQNQYFKTFQQNKCLENCAVPLLPPSVQQNSILSNLNNNVNSSQLYDCKSQFLSYQQAGHDFVGSHLKNLERINTHLLQNGLTTRRKEGLKPIDNILSKKTDNVFNTFVNKRNDLNHNTNNNNNRLWYKCELCDIQYLDELIYSIHMRYHNVDHPYKCNLCGLQTNNKFQFNLHIIQTPH